MRPRNKGALSYSDRMQSCAWSRKRDRAVAIFEGQKPSKTSSTKWGRKRAHEIIKGLLAGKTGAPERDMLPHIPKTWPGMALSTYWTKHLAEHGEVTSFEEIGASANSRSGRVSVLMRLHHAESITTVEIFFVKRQLNIFDLDAPIFTAERLFAPIEKKASPPTNSTRPSYPPSPSRNSRRAA